jgi:hypothetical protein
MRRVRAFLAFVYDFVVGDDPAIAAVVVAALAVTAAVAGDGIAAWWIVPVAVAAALTASVLRAAR